MLRGGLLPQEFHLPLVRSRAGQLSLLLYPVHADLKLNEGILVGALVDSADLAVGLLGSSGEGKRDRASRDASA